MFRFAAACACVLFTADIASAQQPAITNGQGEMAGEVTVDSAILQTRLTQGSKLIDGDLPGADGVAWFEVSTREDFDGAIRTEPAAARSENDFIVRAKVGGLRPGTRYFWRAIFGSDRQSATPGPVRSFSTLPGAEASAQVSFVVVTGMNYAKFQGDARIDQTQHREQNNIEYSGGYRGRDKPLGYPALKTILDLKPDFFVGTGDNVYYDTPTKGRAEMLPELRRKWHEQFVQPRYIDLFAAVPTYWEKDDHDFRYDDADNSKPDRGPSPELGIQTFLEQLPVVDPAETDPRTYRTHRVSKELQIWLVEGRDYRSPNAMQDGPDKTLWGAEQIDWLKRTLSESDATFKLLISPTPMVGPDDLRKKDNHCDIGGFRHERDEFFAWLAETGLLEKHFYVLCGDRHWQYHGVDPSGVEEFSCGALIDENSRLGRNPGDPQSTEPEAGIEQRYTQSQPSGGFLHVTVAPGSDSAPATLTFRFCDEFGKTLYEHRKTAGASG